MRTYCITYTVEGGPVKTALVNSSDPEIACDKICSHHFDKAVKIIAVIGSISHASNTPASL